MNRKKKYSKLSDNELVNIFRSTDSVAGEAFYEFYNRYHIRIYNYLYSNVNNKEDANDKHQEVFENFIKSVRNGTEIENVKSYLFNTAKNIIINYRASKYVSKTYNSRDKKRDDVSIEELQDLSEILRESLNNELETKELIKLIENAISNLKELYKEPLIDRMYNYLTVKEIAEKYDLSYDGAKKRLERACELIKKYLKPYIDDVNNIKS